MEWVSILGGSSLGWSSIIIRSGIGDKVSANRLMNPLVVFYVDFTILDLEITDIIL